MQKIALRFVLLTMAVIHVSLSTCADLGDKQSKCVEYPEWCDTSEKMICYAASHGLVDEVKHFVESGVSVNLCDFYGRPLLFYALDCKDSAKSFQIVNCLLQQPEIIVDARNHYVNGGYTPLMQAAAFFKTDIVALLLQAGADRSLKSYSGIGETAEVIARRLSSACMSQSERDKLASDICCFERESVDDSTRKNRLRRIVAGLKTFASEIKDGAGDAFCCCCGRRSTALD